MADRPILFSGPMARALVEGRKTQTRRVVKVRGEVPPVWATFAQETTTLRQSCGWKKSGYFRWSEEQVPGEPLKALRRWPIHPPKHPMAGDHFHFRCPYGRPGDLLWVRETCCPDWADKPVYKADGGSAREAGYPAEPRWRSSIHMPRWSSRLTLRITDVRVERLTAISDDDIWAEGVQVPPPCSGPIVRSAFAVLWDSINGAGSFDANPWVWALTFEVIPRNIDAVLLELANAPKAHR